MWTRCFVSYSCRGCNFGRPWSGDEALACGSPGGDTKINYNSLSYRTMHKLVLNKRVYPHAYPPAAAAETTVNA